MKTHRNESEPPRTIVITGCTRGIGRALALDVAGWREVRGIFEHEMHVAPAPRLHYDLRWLDATLMTRDDGAVKRWAERVLALRGAPDLLLNNAALMNDLAPLWKVPAEEFDAPPALDFRAAHGITTRFVVLCVANFFPSKGHRHVIEAVRRLGRPDVTLVLIGREGAALAASRAAAAALPQARILTTATRQETVAAFHAADAFLFGSELECAPLVLLEAMASRTPFVSTDVGNARLLPGGVIAPVDSLAQALGAVLDDAARREVLAEAGHRAWREAYTWEGVVDRYERLYLALARGETATEFRDAAAGVSSPR